MKNDGGPAFPSKPVTADFGDSHPGMSLRDYFAAKAMQAFIYAWTPHILIDTDKNAISERAYEVADAMLKERDKE